MHGAILHGHAPRMRDTGVESERCPRRRVVPIRPVHGRRGGLPAAARRDVVPLSPKIIDLLLYLVARQSALVSKDELFKALWPDVAVTDNALTQAVSELRQALGDDPVEADLHPDRRAARLPVHRAGRIGRAPSARSRPPAGRSSRAPGRRAGDRGARLRQRQRRSRAGVAVVRHRRDRHQRSARDGVAPHHRSRARRRGGAPRRHRSVGAARRPAPRPRGGRQLSARRRSAADHRARGGRRVRRGARRRQGRRPARARLRAAGSDRRAVRRGARHRGRPRSRGRSTTRETSSLEAYQAFTEGRVRLESLDASLVPGAIADFERAIALDPRYALAHVGPRERAVLAVRDVTRAQSAGRARCWRARSITCGARSSSNAIWPRRTRRCRSCS